MRKWRNSFKRGGSLESLSGEEKLKRRVARRDRPSRQTRQKKETASGGESRVAESTLICDRRA